MFDGKMQCSLRLALSLFNHCKKIFGHVSCKNTFVLSLPDQCRNIGEFLEKIMLERSIREQKKFFAHSPPHSTTIFSDMTTADH
jgi:hypothetical protein